MLLFAPRPPGVPLVVDSAAVARTPASAIDPGSAVDHDRVPILRPPDWGAALLEPASPPGPRRPMVHVFSTFPTSCLWIARGFGAPTRREAVNVNLLDEVSDSAWFTNRNHRRAVPVAELRQRPLRGLPAPQAVDHQAREAWVDGRPGFQIEDANGKEVAGEARPARLPAAQLGRRRGRAHAAARWRATTCRTTRPVRFRRGDRHHRSRICKGGGCIEAVHARPTSIRRWRRAPCSPTAATAASASLFIPGHALGSPSMDDLRPGDSNDRYSHVLRRELARAVRGVRLDQRLGHRGPPVPRRVRRDARQPRSRRPLPRWMPARRSAPRPPGPKPPWEGYENVVDLAWIARRIISLGFAEEPWRRGTAGDRHSPRSETTNRPPTAPRTSASRFRSRRSAR